MADKPELLGKEREGGLGGLSWAGFSQQGQPIIQARRRKGTFSCLFLQKEEIHPWEGGLHHELQR